MIVASVNQISFGDSIWLDFSKKLEEDIKIVKKNDIILILDNKENLIGLNLFNWSDKLNVKQKQGFIPLNEGQIFSIIKYIPQYSDFLNQELNHPYFVVGEIKDIKQHPKLEKLKIIKLDVGKGDLIELVSGSVNLRLGLKTVIAQIGAIMPNGKKIYNSKMGGVISPGALCNRADLNLSSPEIKGAIEIDDSTIKSGTDFSLVEKIIY